MLWFLGDTLDPRKIIDWLLLRCNATPEHGDPLPQACRRTRRVVGIRNLWALENPCDGLVEQYYDGQRAHTAKEAGDPIVERRR